jgi:cytidine deaminase
VTAESERAFQAAGSATGRDPDLGEAALLERALAAAAAAYAPYSRFRVGAVAVAASGRRYAGVNVENASYPVGQCAERVALGAAATAGERSLIAVAVASPDGDALPCGACLQALSEFGDPVVVARVGGVARAWRLRDLLRAPFTSARAAP